MKANNVDRPSVILSVFLFFLFCPCLLAPPVLAQKDEPSPLTEEEAFNAGSRYLDNGESRQAIRLLSQAVRRYPESGPLTRLLAAAYLADDNPFWAQKVLTDHAAKTGDCETLSWLAWLHLKEGALDLAESILMPAEGTGTQRCMEAGAVGARWHLLCAMLFYLRNNTDEALRHLQIVYAARELFPEDRQLLAWLRKRVDPGYMDPLTLQIDLAFGWNSNALLASATEVRAEELEVESWLAANNHAIRFVPPVSRVARPVLEYSGRMKAFFQEQASDVGFYQFGGRIGMLLGEISPRFGIYYANQQMLYFGGDRYEEDEPRWFYEAHRGEFEYEILSRLLFFGGSGKRFYRERARTRMEFDAGMAASIPLFKRLTLTAVGSGRSYDAQIKAYDAIGTSELLVLNIPYYLDGTVRVGGTFSYDHYPGSAYYYDENTDRTDTQIRLIPAIWSPSFSGFRIGITYEYTSRSSTIEQYDYDVHEALFHVGWRGAFDPWMPKAFESKDHRSLEYGLGQTEEYTERLQDLLRQEDAAQRSSSCVD